MPVIPPAPVTPNSLTVTALNMITAAMQEIGALAPGETPSNGDSAWVLQKLQRLIDTYNAREPMIFQTTFMEFTLPVNTQPVLIGPGQTFDVNQRPVKLYSSTLILNNGADVTNQVEVPMFVRDSDWWAAQTIKNLTSTLPTDVYYNPNWPNGELNFWPIPTAVNNVRLEFRGVLTQITNYNQYITLPPAYWDALIYPLAVSLCPSFERTATADLLRLEAQAIKAMQGNNIFSPRMRSDSVTQSGINRARPDFNFLNGLSR